MPSSNKEELAKQIERKEERVRSLLSGAESRKEIVTIATKEDLISILEQDDWIEEYEPAEEEIDAARQVLAREYLELGIPLVQSTVILLVVISVADYLFSFPAQVYRILFSLWAAPVSIFSSLRRPEVLAVITGDSNKEAK
jgi:hypothetical protein